MAKEEGSPVSSPDKEDNFPLDSIKGPFKSFDFSFIGTFSSNDEWRERRTKRREKVHLQTLTPPQEHAFL